MLFGRLALRWPIMALAMFSLSPEPTIASPRFLARFFFGHCVGPGGFASKPQFILATALDKVPDRLQTPHQDNALRCPSDAFSYR